MDPKPKINVHEYKVWLLNQSVSPWVREEDGFLSPGRVGMSGVGANRSSEQKKRTRLTQKK